MRIRLLFAAFLLGVSIVALHVADLGIVDGTFPPEVNIPFAATLQAQERVDIATPIVKTATSTCALDLLTLDPDLVNSANSRISVLLTCNNGDAIEKIYNRDTIPAGASLLTNLNRGNFSVNSLIKAVYNRLIADSVITGTISGTAQ